MKHSSFERTECLKKKPENLENYFVLEKSCHFNSNIHLFLGVPQICHMKRGHDLFLFLSSSLLSLKWDYWYLEGNQECSSRSWEMKGSQIPYLVRKSRLKNQMITSLLWNFVQFYKCPKFWAFVLNVCAFLRITIFFKGFDVSWLLCEQHLVLKIWSIIFH